MEIISFQIEALSYALPLHTVREVLRAVAVTPLPGAPAVVSGVINLRGRIVPVVDVGCRFGLAERGLSPDEHFLVVAVDGRPIALRAGRAIGLDRVDPGDLDAVVHAGSRLEHLAGVVALPDGLRLIADVPRFLSADEAASVDQALREATGVAG